MKARNPQRGRDRARLAGLLSLLACAGFAMPTRAQDEGAVPRPTPKTYFTTAVVQGDVGVRMIDYWSEGPKMRARTMMSGHPLTTIVTGTRYIVFDELTGQGLDLGRAPNAMAGDGRRSRPFAFEFEEIQAQGAERVEELVFGSTKGEVWQVTDNRGKRKVWVTVGQPQVPLRVQTFDRATGAQVDIDYQNWIFDLDLPKPFFEAPANIRLKRFEYEAYMKKSLESPVGTVPILYPDLLHGDAAP